jgi:hypothetical protein
MFPSLLVRPEAGLFSPIIGFIILFFGIFLERSRRIFVAVSLVAVLLYPLAASSFMMRPGACGTACMARMGGLYGNPVGYPPVYYYPFLPYPTMPFYRNPYSYYPMLPPWAGGGCVNCGAQTLPMPVPGTTR